MHRRFRVFVIQLLLAGAAAAQPKSLPAPESEAALRRARQMASQVVIVRDEFGVPHISAPTDPGAIFGGIYARAEDEMRRIEDAHAKMIGRASLLVGPAGLPWDRLVLSFEVPDLAKAACDAAPADVRALAEAAADALNLYLSVHPEYRPAAIERWEPWMFFAREYGTPLYMVQQEYQRLVAAVDEHPPVAPPAPVAPPDGSNAWAIAGSRTASGRAMLYINPHIPLDQPYEIALRSDEGLHVSGMLAYGGGLLPMTGFNANLGWTLTVNYPDITDSYAVKFDVPGDALAYRHGDKVLRATRWTAKVPVRTPAGVEEQEMVFAKTIHGPLVYKHSDVSYAMRVSKTEDLRAIEQVYRMSRARNLEEWKRAVSIFGVVFHNLVYADDKGNIGYIYAAAFPRRDPSVDASGVLDGSNPRADWLGYRTLDELPQVWNPKSGYVQSCNSPPTRTTARGENPDAASFPKDMIGKDLTDGRIEMSHAMLSTARGWTLDDLEKAAFDTKVYSMEPSRTSLLADFANVSDVTMLKRMAPAVELIKEWDGRLKLDSVASTLFMVWIEKVFTPEWKSKRAPGDLSAALLEVMVELERDFGGWRVPWSEINRHQRFESTAGLAVSDDRPSLPIAGGHGGMGVGFCYLSRANGTRRRYGYHGHSYVAAVEFGSDPEARSVVPFGASRDPASPHYDDQATLYANGRLKQVHFTPAQVKASAKRTYHPGE